mmetsp:Transcript_25881/g.83598  ORF Transcript_25881/g.83598 Transcript_25881/m.83598 type:complete len:460 (+) Transcript_25881:73-1452(+)
MAAARSTHSVPTDPCLSGHLHACRMRRDQMKGIGWQTGAVEHNVHVCRQARIHWAWRGSGEAVGVCEQEWLHAAHAGGSAGSVRGGHGLLVSPRGDRFTCRHSAGAERLSGKPGHNLGHVPLDELLQPVTHRGVELVRARKVAGELHRVVILMKADAPRLARPQVDIHVKQWRPAFGAFGRLEGEGLGRLHRKGERSLLGGLRLRLRLAPLLLLRRVLQPFHGPVVTGRLLAFPRRRVRDDPRLERALLCHLELDRAWPFLLGSHCMRVQVFEAVIPHRLRRRLGPGRLDLVDLWSEGALLHLALLRTDSHHLVLVLEALGMAEQLVVPLPWRVGIGAVQHRLTRVLKAAGVAVELRLEAVLLAARQLGLCVRLEVADVLVRQRVAVKRPEVCVQPGVAIEERWLAVLGRHQRVGQECEQRRLMHHQIRIGRRRRSAFGMRDGLRRVGLGGEVSPQPLE